MPFLEVTNISKTEEGKGDILQNISFSQAQFQKIAIAGETGSGKSTLLKIIAGLLQPTAGRVTFEGEKVYGPAEQLVAGHPDIAFLSQHFELPEFLRVEQALRYANNLIPEEAENIYAICQINHLLNRRTDELSGGEKQRIALARLVTTSPSLLLLDEPFSNLDTVHKNELKAVIRDLGEKLDITSILISHDPLDTLSWADEIVVLREGKILQQGTPEQIYREPINGYVAGLFGKYQVLSAAQARVFFSTQSDLQVGQDFYARPENFKIIINGNDGVKGEVKTVTFFGSYYEIEVLTVEATIIARSYEGRHLAKGDTVFIQLNLS